MKASVDDLCAFGGRPAFSEPVHVGRPHVGDRRALHTRLDDMLDRRWLTNDGRYVQQFEEQICDYLGVTHCIATCNGTTGLQIAARAAGLTGEVIVPAFTFVATAHALAWTGVTPVFCDVDPNTHNVDPVKADELVNERTTGILGVHLWGRPCDVEGLAAVAKRHGLSLMFDAAHAFACSLGGRSVGGFGDAEVFSFHPTKILNAMEGGAVTTDDDDLAERARLMRNFGFADYDKVVGLGTNGKMTEIAAAMGLTSLEGIDAFMETNRLNYGAYRDGLAKVPGLSLLAYDENERCNYQHVVLEVEPDSAGIARDALQRVLWAENVLARRYFHPGVHRMEPYRSQGLGMRRTLVATDHLAARTLVLPNGGDLQPPEVAAICEVIRVAVEHHGEVSERLVRTRYP